MFRKLTPQQARLIRAALIYYRKKLVKLAKQQGGADGEYSSLLAQLDYMLVQLDIKLGD